MTIENHIPDKGEREILAILAQLENLPKIASRQKTNRKRYKGKKGPLGLTDYLNTIESIRFAESLGLTGNEIIAAKKALLVKKAKLETRREKAKRNKAKKANAAYWQKKYEKLTLRWKLDEY